MRQGQKWILIDLVRVGWLKPGLGSKCELWNTVIEFRGGSCHLLLWRCRHYLLSEWCSQGLSAVCLMVAATAAIVVVARLLICQVFGIWTLYWGIFWVHFSVVHVCIRFLLLSRGHHASLFLIISLSILSLCCTPVGLMRGQWPWMATFSNNNRVIRLPHHDIPLSSVPLSTTTTALSLFNLLLI
jgi:hypothetical protein